MKYFFIFGAIILISVVNCIPHPTHPPHPLTEEMKKNRDECRTELGIITIEEEGKHDFHDEKMLENMRCMPACLMKKDGVFEENKTLNLDKFYEKAQKFTDLTEDLKESLQNCYNEAKDKKDDCEFARYFMHCSRRAMGPHPGHHPKGSQVLP